jgi:type IV pilus assembly protein PilZ
MSDEKKPDKNPEIQNQFGGQSSVKALDILRQYKKLNEKKLYGLTGPEQTLLTEIEKKLAHLVNTADKNSAANHRKNLRVDTKMEVKLETIQDFQKTYIRNISGGGLYIETSMIAKIGDKLDVHLQLPEDKEPFKVSTEVAWVNPRPVGKLPAGIGVKFLDLDSKKATKIQRLLEQAIEKELKAKRPKKEEET